MRKFIFGFQGGFDGQSPAIPINLGADITAGNTQGLNCANSTTAGSIAYNQCIGALGNADEFDINLIVTPGILYSLHSYVTTLVVEMCETRGDCFYILDLYQDDGNPTAGQIDEVINLTREFDTSYAGTYYPWVKIKDTNINQLVTVPASVVMPGVYAANDRVAGEWWGPAGLGRGGIPAAVQVTDRTTHVERDTLYENRVNPIAAFPGQGIVAWGQKTLQVETSALDRINVRRLLIEIKKFFASTARFLVFEQNTAATRNKFLAVVNPYLESIQQRSGLYAFQVVMDSSNNTPDIIDRNILYGQIYLKPTKASEFVILDFNIMPTGASFPSA
jgi:phage tail sheath protein FI